MGGSGDDGITGTSTLARDYNVPDAGLDRLDGGFGNDEVQGWKSRGILTGGPGDDRVFGDDYNDRLSGGAGRDELAGDGGNDHVDGGAGADLVDFTVQHEFASQLGNKIGVSVNLATGVATAARKFGTDELAGIERQWDQRRL